MQFLEGLDKGKSCLFCILLFVKGAIIVLQVAESSFFSVFRGRERWFLHPLCQPSLLYSIVGVVAWTDLKFGLASSLAVVCFCGYCHSVVCRVPLLEYSCVRK